LIASTNMLTPITSEVRMNSCRFSELSLPVRVSQSIAGPPKPDYATLHLGYELPLTVESRLVGAVGVAGLPQGIDEKAARAGIAAWEKFRENMKK
jgi:hypothetical protein